MKHLKKILALILALTFVLGMTTVASATGSGDERPPESEGDYITIEENKNGVNSINTGDGVWESGTIKVTKNVIGKSLVKDEEFKIELYKWVLLGWIKTDDMNIKNGEAKDFTRLGFGHYKVKEKLVGAQKDYYEYNVVYNQRILNDSSAAVTNTAKEEVYYDWSPVEITKNLLINNPETVNPKETFNFEIGTGSGLRDITEIDAPEFPESTFGITVEQGETIGKAKITLPNFEKVGVYTYPVTEKAGDTAGMNYGSGEYHLVITVINNPDFGVVEGSPEFLRVLTLTDGNNLKIKEFQNDFSAGSLVINKETTGNFTDPDDEFVVTVTLTPKEGKTLVADAIVYEGFASYNQDVTTSVVTITYNIKKGSSYTIKNIPYDVDYTVVETKAENYDAPIYDDNANGAIEAKLISTTIVNNRDTEIATGINLDNIPYIMVIIVVAGGLVGFAVRKRITGKE